MRNSKLILLVLEEDITKVLYLLKVITKTGQKQVFGKCAQYNRKKSMMASDNTIVAEGLGSFFKIFGRNSARAGKKLATIAMINPSRALENGAKSCTADISKSKSSCIYNSRCFKLLSYW